MEEDDDPELAGGAAELRGILVSLSSRFYSGGWGFGEIQIPGAIVKITGTLEGHVVGTSVIARGVYEVTQYGRQLKCTTIMVDSVSGDLSVIHAWAKKHCKDHERSVMAVVTSTDGEGRWALLCDSDRMHDYGLDAVEAVEIAAAATKYLQSIKTKRELMELGFSDEEAERLDGRYGIEAVATIDKDPYKAVLERVLSFGRIDAVVSHRFGRNDKTRLRAALVQGLVGMLRDGHTAGDVLNVQKLAADIAGVYVDAIVRAGLPSQILEQRGWLQLKSVAYEEHGIARWLARAAALEE